MISKWEKQEITSENRFEWLHSVYDRSDIRYKGVVVRSQLAYQITVAYIRESLIATKVAEIDWNPSSD